MLGVASTSPLQIKLFLGARRVQETRAASPKFVHGARSWA
jgi:hypothetical protein